MKKVLNIILAMSVMMFSCQKPAPEEVNEDLSVYDSEGSVVRRLEVAASGISDFQLEVVAGSAWTASVSEDWITLSQEAGSKGTTAVSVDVKENEGTAVRSGTIKFTCGSNSVDVTVNQEETEEVVDPPVQVDPPVADLFDIVFKNDGGAEDKSESRMLVINIASPTSVNYYNDHYKRYVSHFSHELASAISGGYFRADYSSNTDFRNALSDGHTFEVVFRMDQAPNGSEIKPFSSMQEGGTGFLITSSAKGNDITFLPNVSTDGKSSWKWAQSGVVPEAGRYYHVVGVWDKEAGTASIYVDGVKKGEVPAEGELNFPVSGNSWLCIGGDPSGSAAEAAFNGDVVIARIYDDPLTAEQVDLLYSQVKNENKVNSINTSDILLFSGANVTKGCWLYLYSSAFRSGDVLSLESIQTENVKHKCETVHEEGMLKLRIPDEITSGKYRITLSRDGNIYPLTYIDFTVVDKLPQVNTQVIAHRGYHPGSVPENSLASLVEAQKLGVYGSEFDVYVTLDDVVVLYHNASFSGNEHPDNASLKGKRPDSCTYDEIKNYKLANGERIPTLNDYMDQALKYPDVKLILEIKTHNSSEKNMRAAQVCYEAVKARNMQNQVEYIAFNYDICKKLVSLDPKAMVQYLNGDKSPSVLYKDGIMGVDYTSGSLSVKTINEAKSLGMTVNVWTVNTKGGMLDFINKGVNLITTDESVMALDLVSRKYVSDK